MNIVKKSLRAKFTILFFTVGVIPLALSSIFSYRTAREALFRNVFKELKWNINEVSGLVESHFEDTAKDLVIASKNTAFAMYFLDPGKRRYWISEQEKTLRHMRDIYPEIIDEACYIEASGKEVSRTIFDRISPEEELTSGEERATFFVKSFKIDEGDVFQGRPTISEDTHRWVIPNATPVVVNGKKAAILHFEVTLGYFQKLLKRSINPDRGYGFIINDSGEFVANTLIDINTAKPLPKALNRDTTERMKEIYGRMIRGESGIEEFTREGKSYYIAFKPVKTGYSRGHNENMWSVGYVLPADKVYVEMAILENDTIAIGATAFLVMLLAYVIGNYVTRPIRDLAGATHMVAEGELPNIDVKREDEIGDLSRSFNMMAEAVKKRDEALKTLAVTDGLTGVYNHRFFTSELEKEVKSAVRFSHPLSLIMLDVDFFKHYNDTNGHAAGDIVLKRVAKIIAENCREVDIVARYGGEEFAVILREAALEGAVKVAERIRKRIEEEPFPNEEMQPNGEFTASLGVAELGGEIQTAEALLSVADKALYRAKKSGRNTISVGMKEE